MISNLSKMIFQFQMGDVTFFDDDRDYFEKRLFGLKKFLGAEAGDEDSVQMHIKIAKGRHQTGDRFEGTATMTCPHHGKFYASVSADNIKKCADLLEDKLRRQIKKFHQKRINQ